MKKDRDGLQEMMVKMEELLPSLPFLHSPLPPSPAPVSQRGGRDMGVGSGEGENT